MKYAYLIELDAPTPDRPERVLTAVVTSLQQVKIGLHGKAGARVYRMPWGMYRAPGASKYGWDAPTFKIQSTRIV